MYVLKQNNVCIIIVNDNFPTQQKFHQSNWKKFIFIARKAENDPDFRVAAWDQQI